MNAKDLALPKLNATEDLVDIYTTSAMLGIPFKETADLMTSRIFNWIVEIGTKNIFDDTTLNYDIKRIIKTMSLTEFNLLPYGVLKEFIKKFYDKIGASEEWKTISKNQEIVIEQVFNNKETLDKIINWLYDTIPTIQERVTTDPEEFFDVDFNENTSIQYVRKDYYTAYRVFQLYRKRLDFSEDELKKLQTLTDLLPIVEEMSTLGRQARINQGLKTNLGEFYGMLHSFEDHINTKWKEMIKDADANFSMFMYLQNPEYRKWACGYLPYRAFNLPEILTYSPHFFNMSQVTVFAHKLLSFSVIYRAANYIADEIYKNQKRRLNKNEFAELVRYLNDTMIYEFLKNSDFKIDLNKIREITGNNVELYLTGVETTISFNPELHLNSQRNIASFKHLMESIIIPSLKLDPRYKDNSFIRELCLRHISRLNDDAFALPIEMLDEEQDEGSHSRYIKYLEDFNKIARDSFGNQTIGDLFFLYNLIVNKNGYGQTALTKIFEDLVDSDRQPIIIDSYYKFIGQLDKSGYIGNADDAATRISNNVRNTKIEGSRTLTKVKDYTLDLNFEDERDERVTNLYTWTTVGNLEPTSVIDTFVQKLNSLQSNTTIARTITDDIAEEEGLPKEAGFIKDGVVYINKSRFNDLGSAVAVSMHELAHLIFAAIKVNTQKNIDLRNEYYSILRDLHYDPEYAEIAQLYPDRVGSDLDEEVLCNKIQKLFIGLINNNSQVDIALHNGNLVFNSLQILFPHATSVDMFFGHSLEDMIEHTAQNLFELTGKIQSDYILASQKLAELKTRLYDSKNKDYKLKQNCE